MKCALQMKSDCCYYCDPTTGLQRLAIAAIGQELAHMQRNGQSQLPAWTSHMGWQTGTAQHQHSGKPDDDTQITHIFNDIIILHRAQNALILVIITHFQRALLFADH